MRFSPRYVLKAIAYPVILGGILLALKTQDHYADIAPYWKKLQDVERMEPTTLFLGSSRTLRHVDPVLFDSLQGNRALSYNFGIAGSRSLETHFRADRLLQMDLPSVKRMVVEFGPVDIGIPPRARGTRRVQHYHDFRRASLGARVALASDRPPRRRISSAANRWRYFVTNTFLVGWGRAWVNSVMTERKADRRQKPVGRRGFIALREDTGPGMRERRQAFNTPENRAELTKRITAIRQREAYTPTERDRITADAWIDLASRARARGVDMVFVEQVGTERGAGVTALVREALGDEAVIVLNDPVRYPAFFDLRAWFDVAHLREEMAVEATTALASRVPPTN